MKIGQLALTARGLRIGKQVQWGRNVKRKMTIVIKGRNRGNSKTEVKLKVKKLVGRKCVNPDDKDIKVVVKYPHEKLDPEHVRDRKYETLEFNILIAGELEIINREGITTQ